MRQPTSDQSPVADSNLCRRTERLLSACFGSLHRGCRAFIAKWLSGVPQIALASMLVLSGCSTTEKTPLNDLQWHDDIKGISYHRNRSSAIEYACLDNETAESVRVSEEPRNLQRRAEDRPREITLNEAIRIALSHNEVVESSALGGVGAKAVLTNPTGIASVYDPGFRNPEFCSVAGVWKPRFRFRRHVQYVDDVGTIGCCFESVVHRKSDQQ
ncbi:MAG: hypothetical protein R3C19_01945 [Planctomycetaceae bacterium]